MRLSCSRYLSILTVGGPSAGSVILPRLVNTHTQAARVVFVDDQAAMLRQAEELLPDVGSIPWRLAARRQALQRARYPGKIVFLTVHTDPDYAPAAVAAEATGLVVKTQLGSDPIPALRPALATTRGDKEPNHKLKYEPEPGH